MNRHQSTNHQINNRIAKALALLLTGGMILVSSAGCLRPTDAKEASPAEDVGLSVDEAQDETGSESAGEHKTFEEIISAYENSLEPDEPSDGGAARTDDAAEEHFEEPRTESADEPVQTAEPDNDAAEAEAPADDQAVLAALTQGAYHAVTAEYSTYEYGNLTDVAVFTERDLTQNADLTDASVIALRNNETIDITKEGVYVLTGTASECTVRVRAGEEDKVQLVLAGLDVTNTNFPAIYVLSADKVFITTAENTENSLSVTGAFVSDSANGVNTDAVIYSKEDLVLNGLGSLSVLSAGGNGITAKDDMKITGGTWTIVSALDSLEANDSIAACGGTVAITSNKDGLHSENDDDDTAGWIWIGGGQWTINAKSDAVQGTSFVQIDGGTFDISASEGIEATYVQINDGTIDLYASDDGINASRKSSAYRPVIEINGGDLTIEVGPGDTDGIDSNGDIIVNGGTIRVTADMSSFDYDGSAEYNGGTIIVNGRQVDEIPQSMMGGGHGGGFGGFGGFGGGDFGGGGFGGRGRWG